MNKIKIINRRKDIDTGADFVRMEGVALSTNWDLDGVIELQIDDGIAIVTRMPGDVLLAESIPDKMDREEIEISARDLGSMVESVVYSAMEELDEYFESPHVEGLLLELAELLSNIEETFVLVRLRR